MKVLPLQEYNKRLSEVEAEGDVEAYFKFIREYSCLYDAPPSKEDRERLRKLLESSRLPKKKYKLNSDELKEEIIKEQQRIDREQMKILRNR